MVEFTVSLQVAKLNNLVDALFLGRCNEAASIDDGYVAMCRFGVVIYLYVVLFKEVDKAFRVDKVFRTPHGDDVDSMLVRVVCLIVAHLVSLLCRACFIVRYLQRGS